MGRRTTANKVGGDGGEKGPRRGGWGKVGANEKVQTGKVRKTQWFGEKPGSGEKSASQASNKGGTEPTCEKNHSIRSRGR